LRGILPRLKQRCLDQCRTQISFIMQHWGKGMEGMRLALRLGWRHGLFCIGCCWALMLLMFVLRTANVGWMLLLGAMMAIEKNTSVGRRLSAPAGIGLLLCGLGIIASHSGLSEVWHA